ncbi:hypothetical protein BDA96_03G061000 [Sorghum bicolor]|uniref:Uncharacterized protein n=2 Tax=Sorghum bicolor TaxID=4558 RepID=A0A921RBQ5_SORBI|nr:hypothetical protein BDA96_03G061000 [Sorghum bicolor]OQU86249.1 hypothetical protein SORBI_3003G057050 [Sorghum bicolor]
MLAAFGKSSLWRMLQLVRLSQEQCYTSIMKYLGPSIALI